AMPDPPRESDTAFLPSGVSKKCTRAGNRDKPGTRASKLFMVRPTLLPVSQTSRALFQSLKNYALKTFFKEVLFLSNSIYLFAWPPAISWW
ncbi:MAG: hypothetical protein ACRD82_24150, partial [Blastocatellia bacterium]